MKLGADEPYYNVGHMTDFKDFKNLDETVKSIFSTIGDNYDLFRFYDCISLSADLNGNRQSLMDDLNNLTNLGMVEIDLHLQEPVMKIYNFYLYLKNRIEQEFIGNICYLLCYVKDGQEHIILFFNDVVKANTINFNYPYFK